jgi:DNA polymerase-3 subunit beta
MKALCHRDGLLTACQLASVAVAARDVKPILRNLKAIAETKTNRCTLMATDLELGLRLEVASVEVEEGGEAILPAARLTAILRESTDDKLSLEASPTACVIRGQYNEFEMPGEEPSDFPDIPTFSDDKHHELAADVLREMVRRTVFAAAKENPRYAMTGVLWELEDKQARLVATDGRRLAVASGPATAHGGHSTGGQTHVVPTKAMGLLERILQSTEEPVHVSLRPNEALFKTERAVIYSRLVEGRYPNYRDVFPKKQTTKVGLETAKFHTAVRQAAIMIDEESKRVKFQFTKDKLTLQAEAAAAGRSKVELPLSYDSKEVKINFDPHFLTDMLRVLDPAAPLTLELVDGNSPALFKSGPDYSYVVMPLS